MYTELRFNLGRQTIVFYAHEVMWLSLQLTRQRMKQADTPANRPHIPEQKTSSQEIQAMLAGFSHAVLSAYEDRYQIRRGALKEFLGLVLTRGFYGFMAGQNLLTHIKNNKRNNDTDFLTETTYQHFLALPDTISGLTEISHWLYLINYLHRNQATSPSFGWWVNLAGHLLHINNSNNGQQHLYVSDHGPLADSKHHIYHLMSRLPVTGYNQDQGDQNSAIFQFHKFYHTLGCDFLVANQPLEDEALFFQLPGLSENAFILCENGFFLIDRVLKTVTAIGLDETQRQKLDNHQTNWLKGETFNDPISGIITEKLTDKQLRKIQIITAHEFASKQMLLKEQFINSVANLDHTDISLMLIMLISLGYPPSLRATIRQEKVLRWPTMVGVKPDHNQSLVTPPTQRPLRDTNYVKGEQTFNLTLALVEHQADSRLKNFYMQLFSSPYGSIYNTQVNNIMTHNDARIFLECYYLQQVQQDVTLGNRHHLFRPVAAYGDKLAGSTYHDFADTASHYFLQTPHLTEAQLATVMRYILQGQPFNNSKLNFLPNLVGVWFLAEAARNPSSFFTGLMLLDLKQQGIASPDEFGNDRYSLINTLIHPQKDNARKASDAYGKKFAIDRIGGSHPMTHQGSIEDTKTDELQRDDKLSTARQKEASLVLHWLYCSLTRACPELASTMTLVACTENPAQAKPQYEEIKFDNALTPKQIELDHKIASLAKDLSLSQDHTTEKNKKRKQQLTEAKQNASKEKKLLLMKRYLRDQVIMSTLSKRFSTLEDMLDSRHCQQQRPSILAAMEQTQSYASLPTIDTLSALIATGITLFSNNNTSLEERDAWQQYQAGIARQIETVAYVESTLSPAQP